MCSARMGLGSDFTAIARRDSELLNKCNEELKKYDGIKLTEENYQYISYEKSMIETEQNKYILSIIVFSALAVESYIYDYGARRLGDNIMKDHLDKLDIISKWVIIPKMITGKSIDKSGEGYCRLKELIQCRNSIVHNKSTPIEMSNIEDFLEKVESKDDNLTKVASKSIKTLEILAEEIENIDSQERAKFRLCSISSIKDTLKV
ncbi:hypothetical protein [Clostridium sp. UBA1056]|uniref:hypothetical protein n=1 Tax=unclassified Clostridium TaxID=2614128 RepID=UPI0032167EFB